MDTPILAQRGRASVDFQAGINKASGMLHAAMEAEMAARGITAQTMPADIDERHALVEERLSDWPAFKVRQMLGEWASKNHGVMCRQAFEEIQDEVIPQLKALDEGPTTLDYGKGEQAPSYWSRVWFHRTTGGWDASDYNGYVHGELVHKMLVAKAYPGDIFATRRLAASKAPRRDYKRILDMGASSGHYTLPLAETFPDSEIWGIDLSPRMLEHARRVANERGMAWKLIVGQAEDTGLPAGSFGLVTSFILFHEIPPRIIRAILEEAYRLLEPGGDIVMTDVPRYHDLDAMSVWRYDWLARWGGEPYWRASASMDLIGTAREIGFENIEAFTMPPAHNYYVLRAHKPA